MTDRSGVNPFRSKPEADRVTPVAQEFKIVMPSSRTIRIFRYVEERDALVVTDAYREISETLGLWEWSPVVWIGRLFSMDNDFGEHWFDNSELGGVYENYLFIDPARFEDGRDGPCHSPDFRKRFWTDVLKSLELSFDLICDEARQFNEDRRQMTDEELLDPDDAPIADLEGRIDRMRLKYCS
jgi:hypothetical protein